MIPAQFNRLKSGIPYTYACVACRQARTVQQGRKKTRAGWICPGCVQAREARRQQG